MLNQGANQYTGPSCGTKKCFIAAAAAGDITSTVNKGRRAGPMGSLLLLDVYGLESTGEATDQELLAPDCSPIHPRLLG